MAAPGTAWSAGVFNQLLAAFETQIVEGMSTGVLGEALWWLNTLAAAQIAFMCVWWVLYDETDSLLAGLFVQAVWIGIVVEFITNFFWIGQHFADYCVWAGTTFGNAGLTVAGLKEPGTVMLSGWTLLVPIWEYMEALGALSIVWHMGTISVYVVAALLGWLGFAIIGVFLIFAWIELWIVLGVGMAFLPFLIFGPTAFIGWSVIIGAVQACIRLGILSIMVSLIPTVMRRLTVTDAGDPSYDTALALLLCGGLSGVLAWFIPQDLSSMVGGGSGAMGSGFKRMAAAGGTVVRMASSGVAARVPRAA